MNTLLSILQVLLAIHTAIGAVWKFSTGPAETMPSLGAISPGAWLAMSGVEILCALALLLPLFVKRLNKSAPVAALVIAAEMLLFCGLHINAGDANYGPMVYWLVVAAICGFIAYGRLKLRP